MTRKNAFINFGKRIEGYNVPVLNEREIRASAGILFVFMLISLMFVLFKGDFLLIKYVIIAFLIDLLIRVFINPEFSPTLIIGRLIVSSQSPEYVGAAQKKFAWKIGIGLSSIMFIILVLLNSYSIITGIICLICLAFLLFESAFGICLGCLVYRWFYKDQPEHCAGDICDTTKKQNTQKTSWAQILVLLSFLILILSLIVLFNDLFSEKPKELWKNKIDQKISVVAEKLLDK